MYGGKINYYGILGLKITAREEDIKKRYRNLAKKYHPDIDGSDGLFFVKITEAYKALIDPGSRARHNIDLLAGSLQDYEEYECGICSGKGSKTEKVKYGKYNVDSKIVCTNCNGSGIINNQT